jgi:hypothetical protein
LIGNEEDLKFMGAIVQYMQHPKTKEVAEGSRTARLEEVAVA